MTNEVAPIFVTLTGIQLARLATTRSRWILMSLSVLAAVVILVARHPAHAAALSIGFVASTLWPLVIRDQPDPSPWRIGRPLLGLLLLSLALISQGLLLDLTWSSVPSSSLDLALALLLVEPATRAVRLVLAVTGSAISGTSIGAGEMIGILERLIIFVLILGGGYASIGFVIAAKGLARYEKMKNEDQAEYVLLGTLASVFLVLLASVARPG